MMDTCNDKYGRWFPAGFMLTATVLASLFLLTPKVYASNCDILDINKHPSRQGMPDTAIDTDQIPQAVIDPKKRVRSCSATFSKTSIRLSAR